MEAAKIKKLEDILTEKQLNQILQKTSQPGSTIVNTVLSQASEEMQGFVGEHYKSVLLVKEEDKIKKIHLFIKLKPVENAIKAELMDSFNFYSREAAVFRFFDKISDEIFSGSKPWGVKAFVHSENILVLPDVSVDGYVIYPVAQFFDLNHVLVSSATLAHFHGAFANHHTEIIKEDKPYEMTEEYRDIMSQYQFTEGPWLRAATKLMANFINEFSNKYQCQNLEELIHKQFMIGCSSLKEYKETLNVMIHKDLWANNILFQYTADVPTNAILVDFQAASFAPPTFDVMTLLYMTTSRSFRQRHESKVLSHYYSLFLQSVNDATKDRLNKIGYSRNNFLEWCEKARLFGMIVALTIYPYILMDAAAAQRTYDDPDTYVKYMLEDRTEPVVGYARENPKFRDRLLEVSEEFIERYTSLKVRVKCH